METKRKMMKLKKIWKKIRNLLIHWNWSWTFYLMMKMRRFNRKYYKKKRNLERNKS
jgi:hypothetical protein